MFCALYIKLFHDDCLCLVCFLYAAVLKELHCFGKIVPYL